MSASKATRPAFCPFIYTDGETLYLEFDSMVLRFPFTEGGLGKALKHVPNVAKQPGFLSGRSNIVNKFLPRTKIAGGTKHRREMVKVSQSVKNAASALIRKKLGGGSA